MARDMPVDIGTCAGGKLLQARLVVVDERSVKIVTEHHVLLILTVRYFWKARLAVAKRVPDCLERELHEGLSVNCLAQGFE
jgi:hypothetical protein